MNKFIEEQLAGDIPASIPDAHIPGLAERVLSLGEQLCFVRWDNHVYNNVKACIDALDEATRARQGSQVRQLLRDIRSLLSGMASGPETRDFGHFGALTESLRSIQALAGGLDKIHNNRRAAWGSGEPMRHNKQVIALLGDGQALDQSLRWLQDAGLTVIHTRVAEDLPAMFDRHGPVALVVDLDACEDESAVLDLITPLVKNSVSVNRLVFLSRRADQDIRMRAILAGGDAFLIKPVTPQQLLQHMELSIHAHRHDYTVMLIGDSNNLTSRIAPALERAGMTVKCLNNSSHALLSVINFSPDLLMIEQSLSDCSGSELGRLIHQLADYEDLPLIYCGARSEPGRDFRPDYPSEWMDPGSIDEETLISMIDRLVSTSRLRMYRLSQLQSSDPVTGLLNRQGFLRLLERGIRVDGNTAVLVVEFDNLQQRYPHFSTQQINNVIAQISRRIERLVVSPGQSAHIGDYTFACVINGKSPDEIRKLGQFMSHSLSSQIFDIEQHSLMVVCSIGIATSSGMHTDAMSLFTLAMHACDEARLAGTNRVSVRSEEVAPVSKASGAEGEVLELVQDALGSDGFRLVYQPIAALRGSAVEKYEVLLRLDYGNNGSVPPRVFIPVAEDHGLMGSVDRWVVGRTIQVLQKHGYNSHFFVKVSSATLHDPGFAAFLKERLARYGALGQRLVFEVSASSLGEGLRYAAEFSQQVGLLGCAVCIEHADIMQDVAPLLEHVKASYVKLGGSAIRALLDDPRAQDHLRTNLDHAEQKGAMTIAGFVEDADTLQLLWRSGVHYIQGNFLQKPNASLAFEFGVEGTVQEGFSA